MARSKLWWGYPSPRANPPAASGRNVVLRLRLAAPGITASTRTNRTRLLDLDAYFDRIAARSRGCTQARGHSAPHVRRRDRVQLVDEEGCCAARIRRHRVPATRREVLAGTLAVVRLFDAWRALEKGDRALNIDPPTVSYAIMRTAPPYRGENSGPATMIVESLKPRPGIGEQHRPTAEVRRPAHPIAPVGTVRRVVYQLTARART